MAHNIFGNRFLSNRQVPWHKLGLTLQEDVNAREGLNLIGGQAKITLDPLYTEVEGENGLERITLQDRSITRHPTDDDPQMRHFGIVGPRYHLLTMEDVVNIWDAVVGKPIETIGFLDLGRNAFMTSKLPSIDVNGDEINRYVLLTTPLDGMKVASIVETDVRVVCQNTLIAAEKQALSTFKVVHDPHASRRIAMWLKETYDQAENNVAVIKEAFEVLTTKQVKSADVDTILENVYPTIEERTEFDFTLDPKVVENRIRLTKQKNSRSIRYREATIDLFEGRGRGMDTKAAKGTTWGLYNAVVELEDYRVGTNRGGIDEGIQVAKDTMFGDRMKTKNRAFDVCREYSLN